ncbi:G protein-coupled glucose receptor regulating Gpa2-domain-containing protein [Podospora fimiseda]|uniref:G protein-coupled glucose receptor regulating Gpa2-domain-containing protein n=1 Tax=Podospora fimiseda TaxID=252190 RepID=A0AAN7GYD7_9PEZI|nr:G protein-coupled glucose receptor regulating Gpa2-domain-containing protein [Podospora fimiseda]
MADDNNNGKPTLRAESDSLVPLPAAHRNGLTAVAVLAALSYASCFIVLLYLTTKLIRWHIKCWREKRRMSQAGPGGSLVDLSLGLAERHIVPPQQHGNKQGQKKRYPNQFVVLVYNLLLADVHQASAFLLNAVWVGGDGIKVRNAICWMQGWLVSTGDLSSSLFITAIAVHTYLAVVRNYTPPHRAVYATVIGLWFFNYFMALLGIAITRNGKGDGGFYVRAAAWCWMNIEYETYRLTLHYLWIFISLAVTSILYILIFLHLRKSKPTQSETTQLSQSQSQGPSNSIEHLGKTFEHSGGHHRAFLLYPVIYVVCTAPLAIGRIATMAGAEVSISYFCAAGALITSNGWLDVLLWGVTRHRLLFSSEIDNEDSGIGTFTFMRTPHGRNYGNMVWVEGQGDWSEGSTEAGWGKKRMGGWRRLGLGTAGSSGMGKPGSQETLRGADGGGNEGGCHHHPGMAIQMDLVTTVVVEERDKGRRGSVCVSKGIGGGRRGEVYTSSPTSTVGRRKGDDG